MPSKGNNTKLQLPLELLEEEFKVSLAREVMMYKNFSDSMTQDGVVVKMSRKRRAEKAMLHYNDLVGLVIRGRAGLGKFSTPHYETAKGRKRCRLIKDEV